MRVDFDKLRHEERGEGRFQSKKDRAISVGRFLLTKVCEVCTGVCLERAKAWLFQAIDNHLLHYRSAKRRQQSERARAVWCVCVGCLKRAGYELLALKSQSRMRAKLVPQRWGWQRRPHGTKVRQRMEEGSNGSKASAANPRDNPKQNWRRPQDMAWRRREAG